jgi:two-component system chemotaxis response regulator CheB
VTPSAGPGPAEPGALVVIGASWGGLHAVSAILRGLPADHRVPIVVVQHRSREAEGLLARLLQDVTPLQVCEVDDKQAVLPAHLYVAPPDYHLLVEDGPEGAHFTLSTDGPVRYSRPSIDVTMVSAAEAYGARALAVVCTGANDDGARGARRIVDRGGAALVQDPATAEVRTMPEAAHRLLATAPPARWELVPLEGLGERIGQAARTVLLADGALRGAAA